MKSIDYMQFFRFFTGMLGRNAGCYAEVVRLKLSMSHMKRFLLAVIAVYSTTAFSSTCTSEAWTSQRIHRESSKLVLDFNEVYPKHRSSAVATLIRDSWRQLTPDEARELSSRLLPQVAAGSNFYLVRAIRDPNGTGGFQVSLAGATLSVVYGSLGPSSGENVFKTALVVPLPRPPERVEVSCYGAL
jgi:hypothetical protein